MVRYRLSVSAFIFITAVAVFLLWPVSEAHLAPTLIAPTGAEISLLIADTPEERELGLGQRASLGEQEAMLFVFDVPARYSVWMKGMLFPLDIVWLDAELRVVHVEEHVATSTYPRSYEPPEHALYVLELSADAARKMGIVLGAALRLKEKLPQ